MRYWYPRFDGVDLLGLRLGGPGLGNLLLTWARCHVKAARWGEPVLRPTWAQLKAGPLWRRERDLRWYGHLFGDSAHEMCGWQRAAVLMRARRVDEACGARPAAVAGDRPVVVEVRGLDGLFDELIGHHELIVQRLGATVKPQMLSHSVHRPDAIAVHVRLGDFSAPVGPTDMAAPGPSNTRQSLSWYRDAVLRIRAELGAGVPVLLFSDGHDHELHTLSQLPGVERVPSRDALSDLLGMSACAALVASGSTYSMWASFLGQMPTLWPPGQQRRALTAHPDAEAEYAGGSLPSAFVAHLAARLRAAAANVPVATSALHPHG